MRSFVVAIFMPNLIIRWRVFGKKEKTSWDESEIKRKKKQKTLLSDVTSHRDRKCLFYKRRMCIISYYIMLICRVRDCSCSSYDVMKLSVWMKILTLFNFFFWYIELNEWVLVMMFWKFVPIVIEFVFIVGKCQFSYSWMNFKNYFSHGKFLAFSIISSTVWFNI